MAEHAVTFMKGSGLHTSKARFNGDKDEVVLPQGFVPDDDKLYCIEYNTSYPSDPMDCSSFTRVYRAEEVPNDIIEAMNLIAKYTKIVEEYKRNF